MIGKTKLTLIGLGVALVGLSFWLFWRSRTGLRELPSTPESAILSPTTSRETLSGPECKPVAIESALPRWSDGIQLRGNEKYENSPLVSFKVDEAGNVFDVKLARSSGVSGVDTKLLEAVRKWRYKPRPGCGVVESEISVTIHFR